MFVKKINIIKMTKSDIMQKVIFENNTEKTKFSHHGKWNKIFRKQKIWEYVSINLFLS